ncbi:MAG: hypothetical protein ACI37U_00250 [Bacteroides sp.]
MTEIVFGTSRGIYLFLVGWGYHISFPGLTLFAGYLDSHQQSETR